jgi:hypothetical protein
MPTIVPVKKARYNETIILGNPKNKPKTKASLISPPPIPSFPLIILKPNVIIRKNRNAKTPQARLMINDEELKINK